MTNRTSLDKAATVLTIIGAALAALAFALVLYFSLEKLAALGG